jgi:branched-chain amino acid transport system substrate-binding protein
MVGIALSVSLFVFPAFADDTVKIAFIDPLSGAAGMNGQLGLKTFQYLADKLNANGGLNGKKVEFVAFDNKIDPQISLVQGQKAADRNSQAARGRERG